MSAEKTSIEWTDATWNPVTGCTKVSPGCAHCYAESITLRFGRGGPFLPGQTTIRLHNERLDDPGKWDVPRKIFVNSMSDLFHEEVPFEFIDHVFESMETYFWHTYQVLTKRPDRMLEYVKWTNWRKWPSNVWAGVSVENQYWADLRIPLLSQVPSEIRFLSVEPLLKQVNLKPFLHDIEWVIVGGESGPKARTLNPDWARQVRDDCIEAGVPFFFKQWGGKTSKSGGRLLDGCIWNDVPNELSPITSNYQSDRVISRSNAMQNLSTLPPIQPHTEAKHDILCRHMQAWFPILGRTTFAKRLQYIDGFAGPGEYLGREAGSPLLALQTITNHVFTDDFIGSGGQIDFLFVEKEKPYYEHLERKVFARNWSDSFNIEIKHGDFETVMHSLLNDVRTGIKQMPPTLLFIDPFGSAGFSMALLKELARFNRIDVLINFNYLDLNRWILPDPSKHVTLDNLYGGSRWRPALEMKDDQRKYFLLQEYASALTEIGWRGTNFEMINRHNQTQYYLLFGTRNPKGMEVIKTAMRSVSPDGLFRYRDRTNPAQQRFMGMGMDEEHAQELAEYLFFKYKGASIPKNVIQRDEIAWHPRWIGKDLTSALRYLEGYEPSKIAKVVKSDGKPRRAKSFPSDCIITFAS